MNDQDLTSIQFFSEEIEFELDTPGSYIIWLEKCSLLHKSKIKSLNYIFCSDDYLLRINREYLGHDYYTDIVSFPYSKDNQTIEGDIFISIDRVKENAASIGIPFETELSRVMAHGLLHFIGFGDKTENDKKTMRVKEEELMNLFSIS